jgi:hypothetical protein
VKLMDDVLGQLDTDPTFKHFHFDGQMVCKQHSLPHSPTSVACHTRDERRLAAWTLVTSDHAHACFVVCAHTDSSG